jgi:hypothetical protein
LARGGGAAGRFAELPQFVIEDLLQVLLEFLLGGIDLLAELAGVLRDLLTAAEILFYGALDPVAWLRACRRDHLGRHHRGGRDAPGRRGGGSLPRPRWGRRRNWRRRTLLFRLGCASLCHPGQEFGNFVVHRGTPA